MKISLALVLFSSTFFLGCESSSTSGFLFPADRAMEVRYICRLPYLDATAPHQAWSKSTPAWLILNETKVIVYFKNDRTFVLPRTSEITLPPGKYRCML
ncbi:MAG: hypothetical protein MK515_01150 [SAR324 cluster bacterium]|jgi:hypothetical protein|nr:hypothetical protein [SAR324 cluster bacterium]MCH2265058.1 hypothetical protein [SAR324 cluster bacterium]|tara:strand:- start:59 stop:355 length:297 start_codon:yes stop_codon:yes gene_type:complete